MKTKNALLGLTPVFALVAILCEIAPVRIACAVIATVMFITYIVLFFMQKTQKDA